MKLAISVIAYRKNNGTIEFLIQKRRNAGAAQWYGLWEFPQGKICKLPGASIIDLAKYKFSNETNMHLRQILIAPGHWVDCSSNPDLDTYYPFIVTQAGEECSLHFFGKGEGELSDTAHATNHTWVSISSLQALLQDFPDSVCPLNKPAFEALIHMDVSQLSE